VKITFFVTQTLKQVIFYLFFFILASITAFAVLTVLFYSFVIQLFVSQDKTDDFLKTAFLEVCMIFTKCLLYVSNIIFQIRVVVENEKVIGKYFLKHKSHDSKLSNIPHVQSNTKPCIIAAKHSSAWETFFLFHYFNGSCFVLKQEILDVPLVGSMSKNLGMIPIDRKSGTSAMVKMVKAVKNSLRYPVIIFPQGTRVKQTSSNYNLSKYPYKKGIIGISKSSNINVMGFTHNADQCWGRSIFSPKKSGIITVRFVDFDRVMKDESDLLEISCKIEEGTSKIYSGKIEIDNANI
jgi:1-acyl-sn-glycerol-3-phosphate acyltransferase